MSKALNIWREKLEFLLREEAIASDPSQKFAISQQIREARAKLAELEVETLAPSRKASSAFDVFLSHNSADKPVIRTIADMLTARGIRVWLDERELVPGRAWQTTLEEIIKTTRSAAVFVGSGGIGPWEQPEMRACLSEFVDRSLPVIPVLLPNASSDPKLPLFMRALTWVDLRRGITNDGLDRLIWGITGTKNNKRKAEKAPPEAQQTKEPTITRIVDVFKTVGLPEYTYVEPDIYGDLSIAVEMPGKHLLLYGPSGSGKTCLTRRILSELRLGYKKNYEWLSGLDDDCARKVFEFAKSAIAGKQTSIVVVDDAHLLSADARSRLAKLLKQLSDKAYTIRIPAKFILIGISTTAEGMLLNTNDLGPRIEIMKMPPASDAQLLRLIQEGEKRLSIKFTHPHSIVAEANQSFCLCQNICLSACRANGILETQGEIANVSFQKTKVRTQLIEQLSHRFLPLLISFCKQGKIPNGNRNPFLLIVKAIAAINKPVIRIPEIISQFNDDADAINRCKGRIKQSMDKAEGSETFVRLFHYDEQIEVFSIEDPLFRYYLNFMDISALTKSLGL